MKLSYNITGQKRKELVSIVSEALNAPVKYLGAPTFAYEVGNSHIDRNGTLTGADNRDLEDALHQQGFETAEREYDDPGTYESGLGSMGVMDDDPDIMAIEVPLTGFTPEKIDNLIRLVHAKSLLLKAALGVEELPIRQSDEDGGKLRFPWFIGMTDADTANAYALLIGKLCEAAKAKTRVTAREREVDNPKYAMRCWLLSLGFIGDEYKQARKILLQNLHGNGAYKSAARQGAEVQDDVSE